MTTPPTTIEIAGRLVGDGYPCLVVAEVAQAHDGSLGTAHAYIDAAARAGADVIKFQTHIAAAESTPGEPFRVRFSPQDASRYEYWERMEFTEAQWVGLAEHAKEKGMIFMSTPFSLGAIELLERVGVPAWKVGSGDLGATPMLRRMALSQKPVILSSGMSPLSELDDAVSTVRTAGGSVAVLQCTTAYPCPPERVGLNVVEVLRARYDCPVGLSDHSGTIFPGIAAAVLGASIVEVHIVFSRECFGPDVAASVTIDELAEFVRGIRFVEKMRTNPVDKDTIPEDLARLKTIFARSVVAARDLAADHILSEDDLSYKKPGTGFPASRADELIGRRLRQALTADSQITEHDLE